MVSPLAIVNIAAVLKFSPHSVTGVRSTAMSGPATARNVPSSRRLTQGIVAP